MKTIIFRATSDGSVTQNADGSITAGAFQYELGYISIKRKYIKRKRDR